MASNISLGTVGRILRNSITSILFTLFMLASTYGAFTMDYGGAATFFVIVSLVSLLVLYRNLSNELVRERFSTE